MKINSRYFASRRYRALYYLLPVVPALVHGKHELAGQDRANAREANA